MNWCDKILILIKLNAPHQSNHHYYYHQDSNHNLSLSVSVSIQVQCLGQSATWKLPVLYQYQHCVHLTWSCFIGAGIVWQHAGCAPVVPCAVLIVGRRARTHTHSTRALFLGTCNQSRIYQYFIQPRQSNWQSGPFFFTLYSIHWFSVHKICQKSHYGYAELLVKKVSIIF